MVLLIILGILGVFALMAVSMYNSLVKLRNNRENAFADIDVQLKQRHDLIPQLVETVKGYASHEKETLERVINARNGAMSAQTIDQKIAAENMLSSALSGLKITLEAYPDLKANQNFLQLQEEISDLENKLSSVRRYFNSATKELNNAIQTFPSNILAGMFGFHKEVMFDLGEQRERLKKLPKLNSNNAIHRYTHTAEQEQFSFAALAYFVSLPGHCSFICFQLFACDANSESADGTTNKYNAGGNWFVCWNGSLCIGWCSSLVRYCLFCEYKYNRIGNQFEAARTQRKQTGLQPGGKPLHGAGDENA